MINEICSQRFVELRGPNTPLIGAGDWARSWRLGPESYNSDLRAASESESDSNGSLSFF